MKQEKTKDLTLLATTLVVLVLFGLMAQIQANKRIAWQKELSKRDSINAINQFKIDSIAEANSDYSETFKNLLNEKQ